MAIHSVQASEMVVKSRHLLTSAKTVKKRSRDDKMQLCGLILIVERLFNPICPASSRA